MTLFILTDYSSRTKRTLDHLLWDSKKKYQVVENLSDITQELVYNRNVLFHTRKRGIIKQLIKYSPRITYIKNPNSFYDGLSHLNPIQMLTVDVLNSTSAQDKEIGGRFPQYCDMELVQQYLNTYPNLRLYLPYDEDMYLPPAEMLVTSCPENSVNVCVMNGLTPEAMGVINFIRLGMGKHVLLSTTPLRDRVSHITPASSLPNPLEDWTIVVY